MSAGHRFGLGLRAAALLVFGALGLHGLRYLAAYGSDASAALGAHGHGYLASVAPILALVAASTLLAVPVLGALARERTGAPHPLRRAAVFSVALFAVFTVQELAEGAFARGHPAGVDAVFGGGGWVAVPLAALFGGLASVATSALERVEATIAAALIAVRRRRRAPAPSSSEPTLPELRPLATRGLAFGIARRPPPAPLRS